MSDPQITSATEITIFAVGDAADGIIALAQAVGAKSASDLVARALAAYDLIVKTQSGGGHVEFVHGNGACERIKIL